jgi:hypothetical protein
MRVHSTIRLVGLVAICVMSGVLYTRLKRSPEQEDLTRYVELELPSLRRQESEIFERLDRLRQAPGLGPLEARALLVDDVIPRLLKLRKGLEAYRPQTRDVLALHRDYQAMTERLLEACRSCVQVIDDPTVSTADGLKRVQQEFAAVRALFSTWQAHLASTSASHRLHRLPPGGSEPGGSP